MIFKFNGIIPEQSSLIIKMSFGNNIFHLSEQRTCSKYNILKVKIFKKKIFGSLKLKYEINKNNLIKNSLVGKNFTLNYYSKYKIIYNNKEY